jgi:D-alanyl-D-alanine carboxypeptidase
MRKMVAGVAAALLAVILAFPCYGISAEKAVVLDAQTGRILYRKDQDSRSLIASTTKIMTALVVCEQCNVLDRMRIPKEAVGIEGSSMYLKEGEILTIQELLYGLMLQSGNDAAVALAIYCGGTVEGFAELMNDKAYQLGLKNTHFVNPHGLDALDHYSTAADLAGLAAYAMNNPIFAMTASAKSVKIGQRVLTNHNKLLWQYEGADGVKTGYTKKAGRILVSSATRCGRRLTSVTINAPDDWNDHKRLLDDGFANYKLETIISKGEVLGHIEIAGGASGYAELIAAEDFRYPLCADENPLLFFTEPGFVYAPVVGGTPAGRVYIYSDGGLLGSCALVYGQTVEQAPQEKKTLWQKLFGR